MGKNCGVSKIERMAAGRAPWPTWEFKQSEDTFTFIIHSFMGALTEEFQAGGPNYTAIDGRKQSLTCKAFWDGDTLVIEKTGPQGVFREERHIDAQGMLHFELKGVGKDGANGSWGRTFK